MANMPDKIEQLTAVKEKVYIPSIKRNDMKSKKEFKVNYLVSDLNDEVSRSFGYKKIMNIYRNAWKICLEEKSIHAR